MSSNLVSTGCISLYFWLLVFPVGFGAANATDMTEDVLPAAHQTIAQNSKSTSNAKPGTDTDTLKESALNFPAPILHQLGIAPSDIIKNQSKFKNNRIHIEWMDHVHSVIPGISREKEEAIINAHTSLLFIKDKLDNAFFSGQINKQRHTSQLAKTMKWFQETNQSVLNKDEFNTLFGISVQDDKRSMADDSDIKIDFPINNPETTVEMIKKSFDATTIRKISRFYQVQSQELRDMKKVYETEDLRKEDAKQIKNEMQMIEKELDTAFKSYCVDILSKEQFNLIFGTSKNK